MTSTTVQFGSLATAMQRPSSPLLPSSPLVPRAEPRLQDPGPLRVVEVPNEVLLRRNLKRKGLIGDETTLLMANDVQKLGKMGAAQKAALKQLTGAVDVNFAISMPAYQEAHKRDKEADYQRGNTNGMRFMWDRVSKLEGQLAAEQQEKESWKQRALGAEKKLDDTLSNVRS